MSTRVFTINEDFMVNVRARHSAGGFLSINPKKEKPGAKKAKVTYLDVKFNLDGKPCEGWFRFDDGVVARDAADPNDDTDIRNEYKNDSGGGMRNIIEVRHPLLTEFIMLCNEEYLSEIKRLIAAGAITVTKQDIKPLIVTTYGDKHEKKGETMPEEYLKVNLKIDFGKYSDKYFHNHLRGMVKTQICDAEKQYTEPKTNRIAYETMKVGDALIGQDNFHEVIKRDAGITMGRIHMSSAVISQAWVSMPIECAYIVIKPAGPGGFVDETVGPEAVAAARAALTSSTAELQKNPPQEETGNASSPPPPQVDAVANLLSSI